MSEIDESHIIRQCQGGDKEAFRILIERYQRTLFGTAFLMTSNRESAEDAVQRALLKMWRHISSLRKVHGFKSWAIRIVVNEVNQMHRKKQVPVISLEEATDPGGNQDETETFAVTNERHRFLKQALGYLPDQQYQVIVLRYFSELTIPEISSVTGVREGTVKSRINRALVRLGEILQSSEQTGEARK